MSFDLKFIYSERNEIERIQYTIIKIAWFREQKYSLIFPNKIKDLPDDAITGQLINEAVREEYNEEEYEELAKKVGEGWKLIKEDFEKNLKKLGLPIQDAYLIYFTKYGVGGSYDLPNKVIMNINNKREPLSIITHEILHLTIEPLIQEYKIDHWTKERLVDLMHNMFRNENDKQRDPENAEEVNRIFEMYFPDISMVIREISKISK